MEQSDDSLSINNARKLQQLDGTPFPASSAVSVNVNLHDASSEPIRRSSTAIPVGPNPRLVAPYCAHRQGLPAPPLPPRPPPQMLIFHICSSSQSPPPSPNMATHPQQHQHEYRHCLKKDASDNDIMTMSVNTAFSSANNNKVMPADCAGKTDGKGICSSLPSIFLSSDKGQRTKKHVRINEIADKISSNCDFIGRKQLKAKPDDRNAATWSTSKGGLKPEGREESSPTIRIVAIGLAIISSVFSVALVWCWVPAMVLALHQWSRSKASRCYFKTSIVLSCTAIVLVGLALASCWIFILFFAHDYFDDDDRSHNSTTGSQLLHVLLSPNNRHHHHHNGGDNINKYLP